jgi:cysteine desulfurase/selenocysteine lyase
LADPVPFDIARARKETRGCDQVLHLSSCGSSLPPAPVQDFLYDFLRQEEMAGGYETAAARAGDLEHFYDATARLIGGQRDEIAFIENATRAWDMAFYGTRLKAGDRVLTTVSEYGSNMIAYLHRKKRDGIVVDIVPDDAHGQIDLAALEAMIDDKVKLISITHIPTGGGLVNPAAGVGAIAQAHNIPYLLDACQSVGQMPIDVEAIGCDMLSVTGRKFLRAPRGTGFLWVRGSHLDALDPPLPDQFAADLVSETHYEFRPGAKRFENWERYFAGQATLGQAIDYALDWGLDAIWARIQSLADQFRAGLLEIPGVEIGDQGQQRCGIVTFRHATVGAGDIKQQLAAQKIAVSVSSGSGQRVSFDRRGIAELVRAGVHYYNTEDEIDRAVAQVRKIVS